MFLFFASVGLLLLGYFVYGAVVDRAFGVDPSRPTPAVTMADGVDYMVMPTWKMSELTPMLPVARTSGAR